MKNAALAIAVILLLYGCNHHPKPVVPQATGPVTPVIYKNRLVKYQPMHNFILLTAPFSKKGVSNLQVLDEDGDIIFYKTFTDADGSPIDFKYHPSGFFSYGLEDSSNHLYEFILNRNFEAIDTIVGDGKNHLSLHDFILLPNGHRFIIEEISKQAAVPELTHNNSVKKIMGVLVCELDSNNKFIRCWKGLDQFKPGDMPKHHFTRTFAQDSNVIDLVHVNSISYDSPYVLMSSRNLDEIMKIDLSTDKIVWHLGGAESTLRIKNDSGFNSQHCAKFEKGGKITVFDNSYYANGKPSRAVEYQISDAQKTAVKTWEYKSTNRYSKAHGGVQNFRDSLVLISWGEVPDSIPNATLVTRGKTTMLDLNFDSAESYRDYIEEKTILPERPKMLVKKDGNDFIIEAEDKANFTAWNNGSKEVSIKVLAADTAQNHFYYIKKGIGFYASEKFNPKNAE